MKAVGTVIVETLTIMNSGKMNFGENDRGGIRYFPGGGEKIQCMCAKHTKFSLLGKNFPLDFFIVNLVKVMSTP